LYIVDSTNNSVLGVTVVCAAVDLHVRSKGLVRVRGCVH